MNNHISKLKAALLGVPGLASVTRGQPERSALLPCAAISREDTRETRAFDDRAYLTHSVYRVRLFGRDVAALDELAESVDAALTARGFRLAFAADQYDEPIKQKTLKYSMDD